MKKIYSVYILVIEYSTTLRCQIENFLIKNFIRFPVVADEISLILKDAMYHLRTLPVTYSSSIT